MNKTAKITAFVVAVIVLVGGVALWHYEKTSQALHYRNDQYGFTFALPQDWKGYTTLDQTWIGSSHCSSSPNGYCQTDSGPEIVIRNPNWTEATPLQDIPIMVFTPDQWKEVQQWTLSVSAAPVLPTELGSNSQYVFALPARYDALGLEGAKEVEDILKTNPLSTQQPTATATVTTDHTQADEAAIRNFMGNLDLQFTYERTAHPTNFTAGVETVIGNGAGRIDTPADWDRRVNIYSNTPDELVPDGLCEVYEYEVDARNSTIVEVHIRTLTPEETAHMMAVGTECKANPTEAPALTKAQVQTIAAGYLSRGVSNYSSIKDQFTYAALSKYAVHEWSWKDTSFVAPKDITFDPFPYPLVRIQLAADGTLAFYGNTTGLFQSK